MMPGCGLQEAGARPAPAASSGPGHPTACVSRPERGKPYTYKASFTTQLGPRGTCQEFPCRTELRGKSSNSKSKVFS